MMVREHIASAPDRVEVSNRKGTTVREDNAPYIPHKVGDLAEARTAAKGASCRRESEPFRNSRNGRKRPNCRRSGNSNRPRLYAPQWSNHRLSDKSNL